MSLGALLTEMVKPFRELLQFKVYKPRTHLLYGYCITFGIDQQERKSEYCFAGFFPLSFDFVKPVHRANKAT